ncbi:hypothetical protein [Pseudanabaena sp. PCC 6802]|nr:hypothetical protein [Pseudanabaena sp. PCC 6802]
MDYRHPIQTAVQNRQILTGFDRLAGRIAYFSHPTNSQAIAIAL